MERCLERAELEGPFAPGSTIRMTSKDGEADTVGPELGLQISGDFPDMLDTLAHAPSAAEDEANAS